MNLNASMISDDEIIDFYSKVSTKVKYYRELKKVTQLDLALDIGIKSVAFYSNCENNKYDKHFNMEHIYKISKALDVNICEFFK